MATDLDGKGSDPDPAAGFHLVFAVELSFYRMGFERADDPHRSMDLRPRRQSGKIPPQARAVAEGTGFRSDSGEQRGGILIQVAPARTSSNARG